MKSGTPSHIKTKKLKMLLKLPLWQVVGILESLWHFAGDCADDGGVGRYSNEDIAAYMEWDGDPDELINAFVHCRWLDPHPVHRLVVHDWEDERPYYIEERIRKREQRLAAKKPGTRPEEAGTRPPNSGTVPGRGQENGGQSDQTKPKQTQPNPTKANPTDFSRRLRFDEEDMGLAIWMFDLIQTMQPDRRPPNFDAWANTFRIMRENDGRAPPEIRSLFEWCNRDSFWKTNVLSPDKLREKWDDLQLKRTNNRNGKSTQASAGKQYDPDAKIDF